MTQDVRAAWLIAVDVQLNSMQFSFDLLGFPRIRGRLIIICHLFSTRLLSVSQSSAQLLQQDEWHQRVSFISATQQFQRRLSRRRRASLVSRDATSVIFYCRKRIPLAETLACWRHLMILLAREKMCIQAIWYSICWRFWFHFMLCVFILDTMWSFST